MAQAALLGLDVEKMINGSPLEFGVRARIAERAAEFKADFDDNLAVMIINRLAEATKTN